MTYIPHDFQVPDIETLQEFMRSHDFATIVSSSPDGLVTSHVPVLVRSSDKTTLIAGHLARANHHWHLMDGATPALVIFHGPHSYISPTWYETAPSVPTWNYGAVHAHGLPKVNESVPFIRGILKELAQRYEGHRKNGWSPESVPAEYYDKMLHAIVGFEMPVKKLEGKFKLGQNRSAEDRRSVIAALEKEGTRDSTWLAEFMRKWAGV
jgi:transcriptional regulator